MAAKYKFEVAADEAGLRLDQVIPRHVAGLSRRKARDVIDTGGVFVDPHLVIVDKPAGLVTAPTPESDRGDLLDRLRGEFGEIYLVHRLDMPTSGLLVFARTRDANKALGERFRVHDIEREYRAVAIGEVAAQTIDRAIDGQRAVTHVAPVGALAGATLIAARLETGRTHQIRIHLAGIGHPIAGDREHGGETERLWSRAPGRPRPPRLALHALRLGFGHPATGEHVSWEAPVPDELARWIDALALKTPSETSTP